VSLGIVSPAMTTKNSALLAILAVLIAAVLASGAGAANPKASAQFRSNIHRLSGDRATIRVTYSCSAGTTLWLSMKQVKSTKRDARLKKEGSSQVSSAWLQSHRNKIKCDGRSRTRTFTADKVEKGSKGHLRKGFAWVQFCITEGETRLILSHSNFVRVL
jgi:hypothetical protein